MNNVFEILKDFISDKAKLLVVADDITCKIAGKQILKQFSNKYDCELTILPSGKNRVKPNLANIKVVKSFKADFIIAVGSGTINDICKLAAAQAGIDYAIFATAPSMNGYLSSTASIIDEDGKRESVNAKQPLVAFFDTDILKAAPKKLIQAGFGDSICRSTAQADMKLSSMLFGTYYDEECFTRLLPSEKVMIDTEFGCDEFITALIENLLLSGVNMHLCGSSAPASQGEHMITHFYETHFVHRRMPYHGEQIAVCTLAMAQHQERVLDAVLPSIEFEEIPPHLDDYEEAYDAKMLGKWREYNWNEVKQETSKNLIKYKDLKFILESKGMPTEPEDIGWTSNNFKIAVDEAKFTRDRFTFLDVKVANLFGFNNS